MRNLDLIDWRLVLFSALWIVGLALLLAAFSFADYAAHERHTRTRAVLAEPGYQLAVNAGLVLFCLGLSGRVRAGWETALWIVLASAFTYQGALAWRAGHKARPSGKQRQP
jgi:hypothetical protein